jgi:LmbE family N-acetylglucosaminyl deacetylase
VNVIEISAFSCKIKMIPEAAMKLKNKNAQIHIPDNSDVNVALQRTDILAVNAHQDDLEISAYHGIAECYDKNDKWFTGIIVTNGAGSAREGKFADFTDEEMQKIRKIEQKKAADIGRYSAVIMLDYKSSVIKEPKNDDSVKEIENLIRFTCPETVYTHNLADKHDTHVSVAVKTIKAIRNIEKQKRPKKLYGCEVWRGLDWMVDGDKIAFVSSRYPNLASSLLKVFESQIAGGKRYDLAALGRRRANATFYASHDVDKSDSMIYGMDLTPLIENDKADITAFILEHINRFKSDVHKRLDNLIIG